MKVGKREEIIDIRLNLREAFRETIEEIMIFGRGFRDRKHVDELTFKDRWKVFSQRIDNKDWRFYKVHLKGYRSVTRGFYPVGVVEKLKEIDRPSARWEAERSLSLPENRECQDLTIQILSKVMMPSSWYLLSHGEYFS